MEGSLINTIDGKREVLGICFDDNQTGKELTKIAYSSVGLVQLYYGDKISSGSSFIYKQILMEPNKSKLYFMTNLHVVQGILTYYNITRSRLNNRDEVDSIQKGITVTINSKEFPISEFVVPKGQYLVPLESENSHLDFAIFKVDIDSSDEIEIFGTRNDWEVSQGEEIFAFGYPRGMDLSTTNGIVSHVYEDHEKSEEQMTTASRYNRWCIQHNILINPGNSGGPTVNAKGRIVGISTRGMVTSMAVGINFSINIKYIMNFIKEKSNMEVIRVKEFVDFVVKRAKEDSKYAH
jgi:S1-C subfamily serine protease